jgi:hypothetical protein
MYTVEFSAISPEGKPCRILNLTGGVVGGYVEPIVVRLAPGEVHEVLLALKKLAYVENRKDLTLDILLQRGYSADASFKADLEGARWGGVSNAWTGQLQSGDLLPPQ